MDTTIKPQQRSREEAQPWAVVNAPHPPTARWSVSNCPVTHDSLSSPEQAVTTRGRFRKTWGIIAANPHIWESEAKTGRDLPSAGGQLGHGLRPPQGPHAS